MNLESLKQIARSLKILDKVVRVEEAQTPTWSVGGECFEDETLAYTTAINRALPENIAKCAVCGFKVKARPKCI